MHTLFSTSGTHRRDGFNQWREMLCDRFHPVEALKLGDGSFFGTLQGAEIGSLAVTRLSQGGARFELEPSTVRRALNRDYVNFCIMEDGASADRQYDRESVHHKGDMVLLDTAPGVSVIGEHCKAIILRIPRKRLEDPLGSVKQYCSVTFGAHLPSTSLVTTFFSELILAQDRLSATTADQMASIGVDLIVASIAERLAKDVPRPLHGTLLVQRAKAYVAANFSDSTLDPPQLAAALGVSLRRLQELFHERGEHISDWIWRRRLDMAAQRLVDPACFHLSIQNLAHGCGFATQAHFTRRFKDLYGFPPGEYRRRKIVAAIAPP